MTHIWHMKNLLTHVSFFRKLNSAWIRWIKSFQNQITHFTKESYQYILFLKIHKLRNRIEYKFAEYTLTKYYAKEDICFAFSCNKLHLCEADSTTKPIYLLLSYLKHCFTNTYILSAKESFDAVKFDTQKVSAAMSLIPFIVITAERHKKKNSCKSSF